MTAGVVVSTRRAAHRAAAAGIERCNGSATKCDLRLNQVLFPGTHNSMSSALYPGWLFGEQVNTISQQLDAGVRALLIDTHYGVPSSSRLPGSEHAHRAHRPRRRAARWRHPARSSTPRSPPVPPSWPPERRRRPTRSRDIYLCHNYCELGAVRFSSVLGDVKTFLDTHPDDVVILDIQDATSPADTAAAITAAGLAERAAVLEKGQPLPTLQELIDAGTNLLVFAEVGGPGAPPWYQRTYDWFQETPYTYPSVDAFDCAPNRGTGDGAAAAGQPLGEREGPGQPRRGSHRPIGRTCSRDGWSAACWQRGQDAQHRRRRLRGPRATSCRPSTRSTAGWSSSSTA